VLRICAIGEGACAIGLASSDYNSIPRAILHDRPQRKSGIMTRHRVPQCGSARCLGYQAVGIERSGSIKNIRGALARRQDDVRRDKQGITVQIVRCLPRVGWPQIRGIVVDLARQDRPSTDYNPNGPEAKCDHATPTTPQQ
jgi:hypothetical protein